MNIILKIREITNVLNMTMKDKKDIDEYLEHNELGLAFEVICVAIERDKIEILHDDYEIINELGNQMKIDNELWINLENNIKKY